MAVPDDQWKKFNSLASEMGLPPKDVFIMCAGIGLTYFRLAMHPPKELMESLIKSGQHVDLVQEQVQKQLDPLERRLKNLKRGSKA